MKAAKRIALALTFGVALTSVSFAQTATGPSSMTNPSATTTPVVVGGKSSVPTSLQGLVKKFETERNAYLSTEAALLAKLKDATTPAQRAAIRKSLQENRDEFITEQKEFRQDLKQEITELKDKLNNPELDRLIEQIKADVNAGHHHGRT